MEQDDGIGRRGSSSGRLACGAGSNGTNFDTFPLRSCARLRSGCNTLFSKP